MTAAPRRGPAAALLPLLAALLLPPLSALPPARPAHAQAAPDAREEVHFVRNTYRSVLRRDPTTAEFDRWFKFFDAGGEKAKMVRDLRDTDEYLRANKPSAICARLSVTVYARPEAQALRAGTLLPGDAFRVTGREGEFYRVVGPASGYVERDAIDVVHATQKIGEAREAAAPEVARAKAKAELDKLYADLTLARGQMLDALLVDGRSALYRMKPGHGVAGEKARERYQELLARLVVALKVETSESPFDFRGALLDLRDGDLLKYELAGRLDRVLRMGANSLALRFFDRGATPAELPGASRVASAPWKSLHERYLEEAARRGLAHAAWTSGFDFGPPFAREEPDLVAVNGLGFSSDRYRAGTAFADPALPENRARMVELARAAAPGDPVKILFVSGLFPPETPNLPGDVRSLFAFNKRAVKAFEADTGLRLAQVKPAQEKILVGWLRSALREAYADLKKTLDARGVKLAVVVPDHALKDGDFPVVTYRDCPADYYVIPPESVERFGFSVPGRVIVHYDRAKTQGGIERIDAECRLFRERHPRVAGWLVEP